MNFAVSPDQARSKSYRQALDYELFVGRVTTPESLNRRGNAHPAILAYKGRILGQKSNGVGYADWAEFLLPQYGPRKRCLSLGSGVGRVEKYLIKIGFAPGFKAIELAAEENKSFRFDPARASVSSGDLNFAELPENTYDFILCHGVLHHLINLEFILDQINGALTLDGLLLVYEYIGETRWQFAPEKLDYLRSRFPHLEFRVPKLPSVRGFESVRSGDLMALLAHQFGDRCDRRELFGGVYFPFVTAASRYTDEDVERAVELDEEVSRKGELIPCYCMGIYRKSTRPAAMAEAWSDDDVQARLAPEEGLAERVVWGLRRSSVGAAIRTIKRAILR